MYFYFFKEGLYCEINMLTKTFTTSHNYLCKTCFDPHNFLQNYTRFFSASRQIDLISKIRTQNLIKVIKCSSISLRQKISEQTWLINSKQSLFISRMPKPLSEHSDWITLVKENQLMKLLEVNNSWHPKAGLSLEAGRKPLAMRALCASYCGAKIIQIYQEKSCYTTRTWTNQTVYSLFWFCKKMKPSSIKIQKLCLVLTDNFPNSAWRTLHIRVRASFKDFQRYLPKCLSRFSKTGHGGKKVIASQLLLKSNEKKEIVCLFPNFILETRDFRHVLYPPRRRTNI